ncbi:bMERB domain-containing protein 1 isoform X1 [Nerophis ophidion]|uniref:bMERB domain-containing protein 1 isoform X1 n=1 Tax=Nerophis ophidion TaxID=159077 RepID=UPI002ADF708F|nr:bMERB domain-containing protein 1 isoform X1 [Nerophis ophidion]
MDAANKKSEDVISMADSSFTLEDIEGELLKIERIRNILVRRESELRYMIDDIELCEEITRLKRELQGLVSIPDGDKTKEDGEREEELLRRINKLVETRDFLVDDVDFERLREREEDVEMATFLKSKYPKTPGTKGENLAPLSVQQPLTFCWLAKWTQGHLSSSLSGAPRDRKALSRSPHSSPPLITKTGLTLLKDCCGVTCSVM